MLLHILEGFDMNKVCKFPRVLNGMNFDRRAWSDRHGLACTDVSRAVQEQKDEANINTIVRMFGITGQLPQGVRIPTYDDFTGVDDYRSAIEIANAAEASFAALPAQLRAELDHDPQKFVDWCMDENNKTRMTELGLVNAPLKAESKPVEGAVSA